MNCSKLSIRIWRGYEDILTLNPLAMMNEYIVSALGSKIGISAY